MSEQIYILEKQIQLIRNEKTINKLTRLLNMLESIRSDKEKSTDDLVPLIIRIDNDDEFELIFKETFGEVIDGETYYRQDDHFERILDMNF